MSSALLILRPAAAAPGDLDPSFGSGGTVDTAIRDSSYATSIVVQPDGRIVAGGISAARVGPYYESNVALARYEQNGALDPSFGSSGIVIGPCCGAPDLGLQPDGKILLAGYGSRANRPAFSLVRYRPSGSLDGMFGSGGVATGPEGIAESLALQPDGKIVTAGTASEAYAFVLARFNADGTLDQSFGSNGRVQTLLGTTASAHEVAVLANGKILAAGASVPGNPPPPPPPPPAPPPPPPPGPPPTPWQMTLALYNADGTLDSSFGSGGFVRTPFGYSASIDALGVQPDGKIVVAGPTTDRTWGRTRLMLARFQSDGLLDPTFGLGGIVKAELSPDGWGSGLALQPDGKIVVAGTYGVARYRGDGTLDTTFGARGVTTAGSPPLSAFTVALQQDGRIVTAGTRRTQASGFALRRYFSRSPTTIAGTPSIAPYGRRSVVSGRISSGAAGVRVQILKQGCYELRTRVVATATTGPGGLWRLRVRPNSRTSFQARIEEETSSVLSVHVRPKVTLSKVARGRFRARVVAGHALGGRIVALQRFSRGHWVDAQRVVLRRTAKRGRAVISGKTFRARNREGRRLRLFFRQSGDYDCYASAASRPISG